MRTVAPLRQEVSISGATCTQRERRIKKITFKDTRNVDDAVWNTQTVPEMFNFIL